MRYREIIAAEAAPGTTHIEPKKPLTPAQARHRAERRAGIEKRIRDKQATSAQEIADLRAKMPD